MIGLYLIGNCTGFQILDWAMELEAFCWFQSEPGARLRHGY